MTQDVQVKVKKKKKTASLEKKKSRSGWVFILPFVIGFVLIYIPIIYQSIHTSLFVSERIGNTAQYNYTFQAWTIYSKALFGEPINGQTFVRVLFEGVADIILDIPMILLFSLFMAILLNQKMAGRAAFRAILFVPVILSTGIIESIEAGAIDTYMNSTEGIETGEKADAASEIVSAIDIQQLFSGMAIGDGMLTYVTDTINRIYDIVNRSGVQMLIFLAGLQSISPAIYESVQIDGATSWETFWKITFPMISPMILVNSIYTVIDSFTTEGAVMEYINLANTKLEQGRHISTAMSWIYFLVVIAILGIIAGVCSAYVFYQKKN